MSREIPEPVRAVAGLAATFLDEVRKLPDTLPGLPVRAAGLAMQAALKLQQEYAGLVARGDELFTGIRGEDEPGLATFDDEEPATEAPSGFRESAFDRAEAPAPDADVTSPVVDLDEIVEADRALEELAIEDLVDAGPAGATATDEGGTPVAAATGVRTDVEDTATAPSDGVTEGATAEPEGGSEVSGSQAAGTAPIDGYDGFSIAQLRGRLRGYVPGTVEALLAYEEATRAREPYLRMLRNRLERLTADEVASSPLAPRGV
jgi:hypothetical protein